MFDFGVRRCQNNFRVTCSLKKFDLAGIKPETSQLQVNYADHSTTV